MPEMHPNTFGCRARPGPAGELIRSPDPVTAMGATSKGREQRGKERGSTSVGGRKGGQRERTGRWESPTKRKVSTINTDRHISVDMRRYIL